MIGGLHIKLAALKTAGQFLSGSGWVQTLVQSGVTTAGMAKSVVHASHIKRTRYSHTINAAVLHILQSRAYCNYIET